MMRGLLMAATWLVVLLLGLTLFGAGFSLVGDVLVGYTALTGFIAVWYAMAR